jgi:hypothetical protein
LATSSGTSSPRVEDVKKSCTLERPSSTFEEYAQLLEKVTGKSWTQVVRTKEESEASMKANPWTTAPLLIAAFQRRQSSERHLVMAN